MTSPFDPSTIPSSGGGTPDIVGCRIRRTTAQNIANNGEVVLSFDGERFDTNAFHDPGSNPSRCTIPTGYDGYYLIGATVQFASNGTGYRYVGVKLDGTTHMALQEGAAVSAAWRGMVSAVYALAAGQYVETAVFQNSGGSLDVEVNAALSPEMWLILLGT